MKTELSKLSEQYLAALCRHLKAGPKARSQPASRLGRQAVALGLETLDVARIHEQALTTLISASGSSKIREGMIKRAKVFFFEAIVPIERTHRAALEADVHMNQLNQTLCRRALESSASVRHLKRGIVQRQAADQALKKSGKHRAKLLAESRRLRERLRRLTREILSVQEVDRQKISRELHNKIAQILLGINIRLITLKNTAKTNTQGLKKEIAGTQRLVRQSAKTVNRFAREFGLHHET